MKLQKCLVWVLILAMVCLLAACGEGTTNSNSNSSSASATTTTTGNNSTTTTTTTTTKQTGEITTPTTKPTEPEIPAIGTSANVLNNGAKGDGKTDDSAAVQKALQSINNKGTVYFPQGVYVLKNNITIPKDVVICFERGAVLSVAANVSLTVNGWIDSGNYTIFAGAGTVVGDPQNSGCPQWFGAVGDGEADDTDAFQKAVNLFDIVRVPQVGTKYKIAGSVVISKPTQIYGEGTSKVNLAVPSTLTANAKTFVIKSGNVDIRNFKIDGGQATQAVHSSTIFYFDCSAANLSNITLADIWSGWTASFLTDSKTSGKTITNVTLKNITANYVYFTTGIHMTNFKSGIVIDTVLVNQVSMPATMVTAPLWIIENCEGLNGYHLDVAGGYSFPPYEGEGGDGLVFKNCSNVVIDRFMADYINGYCTKMINCKNFTMINWVCSLYEDGALYMENCENNVFDVVKLNGIRGGEPYAYPYGTTFVMKSCKNNTFENVVIQHNMASAMEVIDSTNNIFKNFLFYWNDGFGYKESGSSNNNQLIGASFLSNDGQAIQQIGSNSKCVGVIVESTPYDSKVGSFTA